MRWELWDRNGYRDFIEHYVSIIYRVIKDRHLELATKT